MITGWGGWGEEVGVGGRAKPPKLPYPCENDDFWQNFVLFIDPYSLKRTIGGIHCTLFRDCLCLNTLTSFLVQLSHTTLLGDHLQLPVCVKFVIFSNFCLKSGLKPEVANASLLDRYHMSRHHFSAGLLRFWTCFSKFYSVLVKTWHLPPSKMGNFTDTYDTWSLFWVPVSISSAVHTQIWS